MLKSLGYVTVATAGTIKRLTNNESTPATRYPAHSFTVEALPSNTGKLYIGLANMNTSSGVGVLAILSAPASATTGPFASYTFIAPEAPAGVNCADIWLDVQVNGEGAVVSVTEI